ASEPLVELLKLFRLVIPDNPLALPVSGKQDHLKRTSSLDEAHALVTRSLLSNDSKEQYSSLLTERGALLV
ncbi:MAG TPA: hypothetical protein VF332_13695, partial [Vicinamibacterales bacterium]